MSQAADPQQLPQQLIDRGLLIEAGFASLRMAAISPTASEVQLREMRMAFFAGAQHLFASLMSVLDPGEEPSERDMQRMEAINKELREFAAQFALRHLPTEGTSQ